MNDKEEGSNSEEMQEHQRIDILCGGCGFALKSKHDISKWGNVSFEVKPCAICLARHTSSSCGKACDVELG